MAATTKSVSLTLRPETLKAIDAAAQNARRSRSQFVDLALERALTGPGCVEARADAEMVAFAASHRVKRA
jgi:hypothetical protein